MYRIGMDLGGTKIEGIVLDPKLNEVFRKRVPTGQEHGYESILNTIHGLYLELIQHTKGHEHTFGIGTPGSISTDTGLLKNSNTLVLNHKPLVKDLENKLNHHVAIENDANCFAMAEAIKGAGVGKKMVFGVIMGTGCGGGLIYEGKCITGLQSIGGEWGHMTIDPFHGNECYCGKRGCVETYISGSGLEKIYFKETGLKIKAEKILEGYYAGDSICKKIIEKFFEHFGIAISNLITILDPDAIVLGGGLSNIPELYTLGINQVRKYIFNDDLKTPILKNQTGDSAGVYGAALIGIHSK